MTHRDKVQEKYRSSEKGRKNQDKWNEFRWWKYQAETNKQKYYNTLVRLAICKHKIILKD